LGFQHLAYDWRDEHIPTWDHEVLALQNAGVSLTAFWAPANTARPLEEPHWKKILELIDRHQLKMQLWVMLNEGLLQNVPEAERVSMAAGCLTQLAKELERRGCQLALYNHGGWSGHPDNLVAIVKQLRDGNQHNTGITYNLHHAHGELAELEQHLKAMQPYLFCLNLNGMRASGSKILPIGAGDNDKAILEMIQRSGYSGLIGILDHREELDAAQALQENLDGLRKLTQ
jgi:sugar phosphate isomerase/epimerase